MDQTTTGTHVPAPLILVLASITLRTPRDLGASLPLSPQLVSPTTSTSVQAIQCTLLCWTYGLIGRNQDKTPCHCVSSCINHLETGTHNTFTSWC
jgi:hypothetical protein